MAKQRASRAKNHRFGPPYVWEPIITMLGEDVGGGFMWMGEAELSRKRMVQQYKHRTTRRYLYLDLDLQAYEYCGDDRYRPVEKLVALIQAFGFWDRAPLKTWEKALIFAAIEKARDEVYPEDLFPDRLDRELDSVEREIEDDWDLYTASIPWIHKLRRGDTVVASPPWIPRIAESTPIDEDDGIPF
jgi:hypothetical protein